MTASSRACATHAAVQATGLPPQDVSRVVAAALTRSAPALDLGLDPSAGPATGDRP